MLRIGLAYMNVSNLGDIVIYETARYLIEQILQKNHVKEYELVPIDIGSFYSHDYKQSYFMRKKNMYLERKYTHIIHTSNNPELVEDALLKRWRLTKPYLYFKQNEQPKVHGLDGIIFTGGGLIKFHKQNFHYYLYEIAQLAQKEEIPVILNAVGVEGYNETNPDCQLLKKALNNPCIKYISTRDDFNILRNNYITNPNTLVEKVCDPALWTPECYQITPAESSRKIGLGVIRPEIFKDYMYYVNQNQLIDIYFSLAKELMELGYQVEIFSNGVKKDTSFINAIFKTYPSLLTKYNVSTAAPSSTEELVSTIAQYERFVSIRLHASIIGCSLGIPNINLVWNQKQLLFGQEMGLSDNYITKENFDENYILEKLFSAQKPIINSAYKESVYNGLASQISKIVQKNEEQKK